VYVPAFAVAGAAGTAGYAIVFLLGTGLWCAAGWWLATRPPIARALRRWGHVVLPATLVGVGVAVLLSR
jgi:cadmium resistance protein CadD (predicted permease)